uniref:Placenta-specific gene 8 protein-like n=1 Tax=Fundulus heteroclitus TaxID=8078 RepID=A0A3Q2PVY0_FUNHE
KINTSVTINQPLTDWDSGLCDCFEDASTCCYGFWCSICLAGTVSRRFGESNLLPLCDTCCFWGGVPPAALSMRAAMRHKYKIKGSLCNDIVISWCCHGLSWCQMHRELKHRKKDPVVINVQAQTAIHMQPSPMMMLPAPGPYVGQPMFIPAPQ